MKFWNSLLTIREKLKTETDLPDTIYISSDDPAGVHFKETSSPIQVLINVNKTVETKNHVLTGDFLKVNFSALAAVSSEDLTLFNTYLPYCFLEFFGKKLKRCFSISHFAQTLDGKIASKTGDSKWIGNEENLIHSHRMRALCDAIMVGSNTIKTDNPRLNVRKVAGPNPVRVVIAGDDDSSLLSKPFHAIDTSTIVFGNHNTHNQFTSIHLDYEQDYDLRQLLNSLYKRGIYSVYIEGGAYTTTRFLRQKALDQIQLHISAKIIGSGIDSFSFQGIDLIADAVTFHNFRFVNMGNEVMFIGDCH
ncbi:MAG: hypothetical protein Roseis2KO_15230 [Roseivirga sp.]